MKLADTQAIAIFLRRPATTIRSWAHRGHLHRKGTGRHGRALYSIDEAEQHARHIDNTPELRQHQDDSTGSVP